MRPRSSSPPTDHSRSLSSTTIPSSRGIEQLPDQDLKATYYDTADLRLARSGITLRYRTGEGDASGWHLKLPLDQDGGRTRNELHFDGPPRAVPADVLDMITALRAAGKGRSGRDDASAPPPLVVDRCRRGFTGGAERRRGVGLAEGPGSHPLPGARAGTTRCPGGRVRFDSREASARALPSPSPYRKW